MANITLLGVDYANVPSIVLPKTGGGTSEFFDGDADFAWLGKNVEYLGEIYDTSVLLKDTSFNGWTPSSTAKTIISSKSISPTVSVDMEQYEYAIRWKFDCPVTYSTGATDVSRLVRTIAEQWQGILRRANSFANITANNLAGNACATLFSAIFLDYYNASGSHTYSWNASYGIYPSLTAAAFSNGTNLQTTMTIKTPSVASRSSGTYSSVANLECVDQDNTTIKIKGYLYRYKPQGELCKIYQYMDELYKTPL